jgi:glyoxylase-like metal-dependent hydrolase (beta-lactamase superfamily II)
MVNFVYLVGDRETGEAIVVDPAYDVAGILGVLADDGMKLVGSIATHYHPDHVGGEMMGYSIQGVQELLELVPVPVHVQTAEAEFVKKVTHLTDAELVCHDGSDVVKVGEIGIELIHTPGHTPGSQCILVHDHLCSGDTLFLDGCGRTDLPGSDRGQMYDSLQRLAKLPEDTIVFPGHKYHALSNAAMGAVVQTNYAFKPRTKEQWVMMFGGGD